MECWFQDLQISKRCLKLRIKATNRLYFRQHPVYITPAQHINVGPSHFPQKIPPNYQNRVPEMNLRGPRLLQSSAETLNFLEFWTIPILDFGVPVFSVFGGNEVDM